MNHAYHFENHRGPLCSGADPRCGGALVPLLHRGRVLLAGVYRLCPAGGLRFFAGLHTGCIAMLVLAFLVSPFGLPAIGEWLLERLYGVKYALQDFMFS
ncbi:MAG: CD1845 family protein [[Eubacterium] siraeum]